MLCVWFIALVLAHVRCMVHCIGSGTLCVMVHCTGSGTCYVHGSLHWFWHMLCVWFIALVLAYVMCMVHCIGSGICRNHWNLPLLEHILSKPVA